MVSLVSSQVAGFTLVQPGCHPGWLGSLGCALGVVGFIRGRSRVRPRGRWVHPGPLGSLGSALGVVRFVWGCWVHSDSPCGSLSSSGVVGFTRKRPWGSWVYAEWLGSP